MKLFGEFLLNRKVVTESQLLNALILQIKQQPPICEIAFQTGLFDVPSLLKILAHQTRQKIGFIESAKALDLWNEKMATELESKTSKMRTPIGRILADQGVLSLETIAKLLDEFWSELDEDDIKRELQKSLQNKQQSTDQSVSNPALENYFEVFNENKKEELENSIKLIGAWSTGSDPDQKIILEACMETIHLLQGTARLAQVIQSEKVFLAIEETLRHFSKNLGNLDASKFKKFEEIGLKSLGLLWQCRLVLPQNKTETESIPEFKEKIEEVLALFNQLQVINA